ncbi:hypothetical protein [Yersinia thracica]|uniref:hypothetical protein n=1 Tax=Yersinia thracica TaxID=2890319 RepID=UPI0011A933FC|nr:hypothetical protein [Yersinia thracica]
MNNIEQIIVHLKTRVALAELIGPDDVTVSVSDLSALIAQLEAAQKENENDNKLKYIRRLEDEKRTEANTINVQRRQNLELMSENASLKDCVESAEAELSAAQQRIDELEKYQKEENAANRVLSAALCAAKEKLSKAVVFPERYSFDCGVCADPNGEWVTVDDIKDALKAAGFTVEGNADAE